MKAINPLTKAIFLATTLALTGCANSGARYNPIVDGDSMLHYQTDLQDCQSLARSKSFTNGDVRTDALAGAVVGAVAGAIDEGSEGAVGGAIVGGVLGGGGRAWDVREERKQIVISCMQQRGHKVVG